MSPLQGRSRLPSGTFTSRQFRSRSASGTYSAAVQVPLGERDLLGSSSGPARQAGPTRQQFRSRSASGTYSAAVQVPLGKRDLLTAAAAAILVQDCLCGWRWGTGRGLPVLGLSGWMRFVGFLLAFVRRRAVGLRRLAFE